MSTAFPDQQDTKQQLRQLCAEMEQRLRAGETCQAEDFLVAHPTLAADDHCAVELVYFEYVLREDLGHQPAVEDWYRRFPALAFSLQKIFQVHRCARPALPASAAGTGREVIRATPSRAGNGAEAKRPADDYEILDELGRGSMGVVYRARQVALNRTVALKMILAGAHASQEQLVRFRREAQAVGRLQHPNIVQVYEIGEQNGLPFLAMELVDGPSLDHLLAQWHREGQLGLTPQDAAKLVETLARAVHYAHQQGVVHRDLKPANVLVSGEW